MAYDGTLKFDTSMDASGFRKDANALNSIVKGLGVFEIIKKGMEMVGNSIGSAVSRYDTLNRFPKIMEQMGYSADESAAATQRLSDGIQGLPTTLDGITSSTKQLVIATGSLDTGVDSALALNNAFLASGATADEASRGLVQYVQMLSSGKVDMQSWRTLNETMTYALQKTAESFGFAGTAAKQDLYDALQDGAITFSQFNQRIIELNNGVGGFAEIAKTSTGGIGTAWTNMQTAIVRGTTGIVSAVDKGLSKTRFQSIENIINTMKNGIAKSLGVVADVFGFAAKNIDLLGAAVVRVGAAFAVTKGIKAYEAAIKATTNAIYSNKAATALMELTTKGNTATEILAATVNGKVAGAEALKTAAKQAGIVVDEKGILVTSAGIAVTEAEALAIIKSSGAMSAKTTIVGLLTGQITLSTVATNIATIATTAWGTAVKIATGPIGIAITAITVLASVIYAFVSSANRAGQATEQMTERIANLRSESEKTNAMDAQIKRYRQLEKELKNTSLTSDQVAEKTDELNTTRQWIIDNSNGMITAEDDVTGAFARQLKAVEDLTAQQIELQGAQLQKAGIDAQLSWNEVKTKANELESEGNALSAEQESLALNATALGTKLVQIATAKTKAETAENDALRRKNEALSEAERLTGLQFESTGDLKSRIDVLTASIDNASESDENRAKWISERERLTKSLTAAEQAQIEADRAVATGTQEVNDLTAEAVALAGKRFQEINKQRHGTQSYAGDLDILNQILDEYNISLEDVGEQIKNNTTAQGESSAAVDNARYIFGLLVKNGLMDAKYALDEYGIAIDETTGELIDLTTTTEDYGETNEEVIGIAESDIEAYAKKFAMSADEVRAGIAAMGGDHATWAEQTEKSLRAALVAEDDYVARIKSGQVEISDAYAQGLEARRLSGEELNAIEQATLDQWNEVNKQAVEEYKKQQQEIVDASEAGASKIVLSKQQSAKKILEIQAANNKATAEYVDNYNFIHSKIPEEQQVYLADLDINSARFLKEMVAKWDKGGKEQWEQYVAGLEEGQATAEEKAATGAEAVGNAAETALDDNAETMGEKGVEGADAYGEALKTSTAPDEGAQKIANLVVEKLENADYSGVTAAIATAITTGATDVVTAAQSMGADVLTEIETMKTDGEDKTSKMMTAINSAITTSTNTVKTSAQNLADGVVKKLDDMNTKGTNAAQNMMTNTNTKITGMTETVKTSAQTLADGVVTKLEAMNTGGKTVAGNMMTNINTAITGSTETVKTSAGTLASGTVTKLEAMNTGGKSAADSMMASILQSMKDNAQSLYDKAKEIADKIASTLRDAWNVGPSSSDKAFDLASIDLSPEAAAALTSRLLAVVDANPFNARGLELATASAGGLGGVTYYTTLNQTINAPKSPSASEATREAENFLRRAKWQLP